MKIINSNFNSVLVSFNEILSVRHQIFYKQHKVREDSNDRPSDLTLFVCNIPPYYDEECVKHVFKSCGLVKSVYFASADSLTGVHQKQDPSLVSKEKEIEGYKLAYVVFTSARDLQNALSWKPSEPISILPETFPTLTGLRKWCRQYNNSFLKPADMDKEITSFMSKYDKKMKKEETLQKQNPEPNEDGWVTITKHRRNPGFARKQSVRNNLMKTVQRRKQKKTLLNFYSFQIKESKMNHLTKLKEKFEEDKKKVENLKSKRKFKPF